MNTVMMACGHSANAEWGGKPSCAICGGLASKTVAVTPDLAGRVARCYCGREVPSGPGLAFFEYRGVGSPVSMQACAKCNYFDEAHTPEVMKKNSTLKCWNFTPHGAYEKDLYYCGCGGWD